MYIKSYTLTDEQQLAVDRAMEAGKVKYDLISDIVWVSNISADLLEQFEKEIE